MPTVVRRRAPNSPAISRHLVRQWGNAMLARLDRVDAELSVLLTDDRTIHQLNRDYRHKDRPTDVLSFELEHQPFIANAGAEWLLGDIVISLDTAQRQAIGRKRPLEAEVRWLLAHGLLHLCGYDHATVGDKRVMVAWTRRLVDAAKDSATPVAAKPASCTAKPRPAPAPPATPGLRSAPTRKASLAVAKPRRGQSAKRRHESAFLGGRS